MSGFPQLVPGEPDKVSIFMLGQRVIVDRTWHAKVNWLANCTPQVAEREMALRREGKPSMLDEEYWRSA